MVRLPDDAPRQPDRGGKFHQSKLQAADEKRYRELLAKVRAKTNTVLSKEFKREAPGDMPAFPLSDRQRQNLNEMLVAFAAMLELEHKIGVDPNGLKVPSNTFFAESINEEVDRLALTKDEANNLVADLRRAVLSVIAESHRGKSP